MIFYAVTVAGRLVFPSFFLTLLFPTLLDLFVFGLNFLQRAAMITGVYDVAARTYLRLLAKRHGTTFTIEEKHGAQVVSLQRGYRVLRASARYLAYCADLIRFFDYYFDAVEPEQDGSDLVVDYSTPRKHVLKGNGLSFYFSSFAEPCATTDIYLQYAGLKEGDVVFDIGAYCGSSVYAFSHAVGSTGLVFAFEPDPQNYAELLHNIDHHRMTNVVPIQKGIWSSETTLEFQSEGNMGSSVSSLLTRSGSTRKVSVTTIPAAVKEYKIDRLDFIKMDIEGAEVEALAGVADVLARFSPTLIIEPHRRNGSLTTGAVCHVLSGFGYTCKVIPQDELDLPLINAVPANR